ncbi:putative disease resistance protein At3g14460 [Silene latifolia]|uniref:putative disease resistance protein At3g14460 n=1 Tax=Silene latifolia TaxID=37657 RepID=UPI003D78B28A
MHDLIHDLAKEVAGKENVVLDISKGRFDHRSCHLSFTPDGCFRLDSPVTPLRDMKTLRTFLTVTRRTYLDWSESGVRGICDLNAIQICSFNVNLICSHLIRLRVLYLNPLTFYTLPETLNNLLHLRDLDLSGNQKLIALPNSITELYNLQVLNLDGTNIRELPRNTRKLVNLRHLFLRHCKFLTHMPPGLNTLTNLHTLTTFVVGKGTFMQGRLRDLNDLVNLRGELSLIFNNNSSCDVANYRQMEFLRTNHVTELNIQFSDQGAIHETLLDRLQPHSRLKRIQIESYEAFKLPGWAESLSSSLPNLVKIHLVKFDSLEILPSLSELRHLKYLKLKAISNVEFMENDVIGPSNDELLFFPSLVELELSEFPKLKGWWRDDRRKVTGEVGTSSIIVPTFSSLLDLILTDCPSLTHFPSCPSLRHLDVRRCHNALTLLENTKAVQCQPEIGQTSSSSSGILLLEMYNLTLDNVGAFHYLCGESHEGIWSLRIQGFEGDNLSTLANKCVRCVSSLKELKFLVIWDCPKLKSLSGALKQLTRLQRLTIGKCENLELENNEEQATMTSWESLHLLSYLGLHDLPKLVHLPQEFQYLTSLRSLSIFNCENLEALPEWISCLTSLQTLKIYKCDKLKSLPEAIAHMPALNTLEIRKCESLERRCRKPDGEDWPKVRHIRLDITPVK